MDNTLDTSQGTCQGTLLGEPLRESLGEPLGGPLGEPLGGRLEIRIPKILFQTWKTKDVPEQWMESQVSIREKMSDWKHVLYTDEDNLEFVKKHFPDFLPYYNGFKYNIQRADAIRYMWLYINGGLYIDLDYVFLENVDSLFRDTRSNVSQDISPRSSQETPRNMTYLVSSGSISGTFTNSIMASTPRNPFWLLCLEKMKDGAPFYAFDKHLEVLYTTGPGMVTKVARKYLKDGGKIEIMDSAKVNPCDICDVYVDDVKFKDKFPLMMIKPLKGSSWCDENGFIFKCSRLFYCNSNAVTVILLLIVVIIIIVIIIVMSKKCRGHGYSGTPGDSGSSGKSGSYRNLGSHGSPGV